MLLTINLKPIARIASYLVLLLSFFSSCRGKKLEPGASHQVGTKFGVGQRSNRPKQPIEYMAEYNVNADGTGLTDSHEWRSFGYFSLKRAEALHIAGYHLPSGAEMCAAIPVPHPDPQKSNPHAYPKIFMGVFNDGNNERPTLILDEEEELEVAGERLTRSSCYGIMGAYGNSRVSYALRFWSPKQEERQYFAAYRYEIKPDKRERFIRDDLKEYSLEIRVRYLGPESKLELDRNSMVYICDPKFWFENSQDSRDDIIRSLPNGGMIFDPYDKREQPQALGIRGRYWLKYRQGQDQLRHRYIELSNKSADMDGHELHPRLPLRLFHDK